MGKNVQSIFRVSTLGRTKCCSFHYRMGQCDHSAPGGSVISSGNRVTWGLSIGFSQWQFGHSAVALARSTSMSCNLCF